MGERVWKNFWERPDRIHEALRAAQKRIKRYLWVPADAVTFKPVVSGTIYGDGRALFKVNTCNDRPRFWIVRGCSSWAVFADQDESGVPFHDVADQIHTDLECEFGRDYEDDEGVGRRKPYPAISGESGLSWGRADWPSLDGVSLVAHPRDPTTLILAARHARRASRARAA